MRAFIRLCSFSALILTAGTCRAPATAKPAPPAQFPSRLSDGEFWAVVTKFSEPAGKFSSENYLSNELGYQRVVSTLEAGPRQQRAYLGVGPEQNFTYIAALRPKVAVIFDIRRGNLLGQLLYKALFELSTDRADFVARLFSKPRPEGLDADASVDSIFSAFWYAPTDSVAYRMNRDAVFNRLLKEHRFALSDADTSQMREIYDVFYLGGPRVDYLYPVNSMGATPSYRDLMLASDSSGVQQSFLATEQAWQTVRDLQMRNLIIPIVADFAGPSAIRSVGDWLREHSTTVGAFYLSNVEQYLFRSGLPKWTAFVENAMTLPTDVNSVFVRSVTGAALLDPFRWVPAQSAASGGVAANSVIATTRAGGFVSVTSLMQEFFRGYRDGDITAYQDVVRVSR